MNFILFDMKFLLTNIVLCVIEDFSTYRTKRLTPSEGNLV